MYAKNTVSVSSNELRCSVMDTYDLVGHVQLVRPMGRVGESTNFKATLDALEVQLFVNGFSRVFVKPKIKESSGMVVDGRQIVVANFNICGFELARGDTVHFMLWSTVTDEPAGFDVVEPPVFNAVPQCLKASDNPFEEVESEPVWEFTDAAPSTMLEIKGTPPPNTISIYNGANNLVIEIDAETGMIDFKGDDPCEAAREAWRIMAETWPTVFPTPTDLCPVPNEPKQDPATAYERAMRVID